MTDGMKYEPTGKKKLVDDKTATIKIASSLSTGSLMLLLVKRHKVFILSVGNVILILNFIFPAWTTFIQSLI